MVLLRLDGVLGIINGIIPCVFCAFGFYDAWPKSSKEVTCILGPSNETGNVGNVLVHKALNVRSKETGNVTPVLVYQVHQVP